jgi:flagellar transcriptional activator FlhC
MATASTKSVLNDSRQVARAVALIQLGARLQVLESETNLSYERLLRLYKEVAGKSPSKGQLPFSTDWFLTWQPNIHASLFLNTYEYLTKVSALEDIDAIMKAYKLYTEQISACGVEPLLSITRAWRLVKFVDNNMLSMTQCCKCGGHFVSEAYENARHFECGLCTPPARAGKGAAVGGILLH